MSSGTGLTVWLRFQKVHAGTSQEERTQLGNCQVLAISSFIATQPVFHALLLGIQTWGTHSPLGVRCHAREPGHASSRLPGCNEVPHSEERGGQGCRRQGAEALCAAPCLQKDTGALQRPREIVPTLQGFFLFLQYTSEK